MFAYDANLRFFEALNVPNINVVHIIAAKRGASIFVPIRAFIAIRTKSNVDSICGMMSSAFFIQQLPHHILLYFASACGRRSTSAF